MPVHGALSKRPQQRLRTLLQLCTGEAPSPVCRAVLMPLFWGDSNFEVISLSEVGLLLCKYICVTIKNGKESGKKKPQTTQAFYPDPQPSKGKFP